MSHEPVGICVESVLQSCPFSFVVDAGGRLAKLGSYFAKHHPEIEGLRYDEAFKLTGGDEAIRRVLNDSSAGSPRPGEFKERIELQLREAGGMEVIGSLLPFTRAGEGGLFIGTISPAQIAKVTEYGLSMSDFAPFDVSADFALMAHVNEAVLKDTRMLNEQLSAAHDEAVSARKKVEAIALVDTLSGLANRAAFQQILADSSDDGGGTSGLEPCSLLLIDIDNFKPVNDHYGHAIGDQLIKSIGERIGCLINDRVEAYRVGGDEFAVIFRAMSPNQARGYASDIMWAMQQPHHIQGKRIVIKASGGMASRTSGVNSLEGLYKAADIALYEAKRSKNNKLQTFTAGMGLRELEKKLLERDLVEAVEQDSLEVFIQPQFDLHTGALWGGEALARWWNRRLERHIPPGIFVPIAEKMGLVSRIDLTVFATIVQQQKALCPSAHDYVWCSNLSPITIAQTDILESLGTILNRGGHPTAPLELEITESAMLSEPEAIGKVLRGIHAFGVAVAIDDFGGGHTSLSQLTQLPISRLKLDRSLVERIDNDARAETIARSIVALAQELGLHVTAEGIERPSQADLLRRMGPMNVQGFLYARPIPLPEFVKMLGDGARPRSIGRARAG